MVIYHVCCYLCVFILGTSNQIKPWLVGNVYKTVIFEMNPHKFAAVCVDIPHAKDDFISYLMFWLSFSADRWGPGNAPMWPGYAVLVMWGAYYKFTTSLYIILFEKYNCIRSFLSFLPQNATSKREKSFL